ncbi:MAG TPA: GntR family transcriptional regulator [Chromatiales bacterium]|jgi:predicted RNA-binding protein (virulence factor B family)|nr:GntR family transcriptional regulator [Chromatiaceae bacterium]HIB84164.1 GntR family transcriptional regulator [Chromatiaceae bacterium]HIN82495.1 GntR family transcriptional regulator [Chromatiales bacterium]HIO14933.1 GntR family transcriptional regulator [Chromatiales bacterium]HIO54521.1 GntR family transcriptional regulator [Chromatiales bacterium]
MVEIGQYNRLRVLKQVDFGLYLEGDTLGEILLPKRYTTADMKIGDEIDIFLYRDSEDRLTATTDHPIATVGECESFKVAAVNKAGAFLDWGLPKDLLVPFNEQRKPLSEGEVCVACVYLDGHTSRIAASTRLDEFLSEESDNFTPGQQVSLLICAHTDLGLKAVINSTHLGMVFDSDLLQPLKVGEKLTGYIKHVREDLRIDLAIQPPAVETRGDLCSQILEYLHASDGESTLTDKSTPDAIFAQFGVSKSNYKKALGQLYKRKQIRLGNKVIELVR